MRNNSHPTNPARWPGSLSALIGVIGASGLRRFRRGSCLARGLGIALALCTLCAGLGVAAPGDIIVNYGFLTHRITAQKGYGEFLERRFGAEHIDLRGTQIGLGFQNSDTLIIGVELDSMEGSFNYKNLNGVSRTIDLELDSTLLVLQRIMSEHIILGAGIGRSDLTRTLYGYSDNNIVTTNLADNSGLESPKTSSSIVVLDALYATGGDTLRFTFGVRYSISSHTISTADKRPGLTEKGDPRTTNYILTGLGYFLALQILL